MKPVITKSNPAARSASSLSLALLAALALGACGGGGGASGGGGGGSGGDSTSKPAFTSFANIPANDTLIVNGDSRTGNGNSASGASVTLSYNDGKNLVGASIKTAADGVVVNLSNSSPTIQNLGIDYVKFITTDLSQRIYIPKYKLNWNYQTFGAWEAAGSKGGFSVGSVTPTAAVPTKGTAIVYSGNAIGRYTNGNVTVYSTMTATVNFETNPPTVSFTLSGAKSRSDVFSTAGDQDQPYLNFSGTASYEATRQTFTGNVTSYDGGFEAMQGNVTGRFYGPNADQIGGTITGKILGTSGHVFTGAFGGSVPQSN